VSKAAAIASHSLAASAGAAGRADDLQKKLEHVLARANELCSARATDVALHADIDDVISFAVTAALPPPNVPLSLVGPSRSDAHGSQGRSDAVRAYLADVFGAMYGPTYTPLSAIAPAAPTPAAAKHGAQPSVDADDDTMVVMRTANSDGVRIVDRRPKPRGALDELRMPPQPQPQAYPARVIDGAAIGVAARHDRVLTYDEVCTKPCCPGLARDGCCRTLRLFGNAPRRSRPDRMRLRSLRNRRPAHLRKRETALRLVSPNCSTVRAKPAAAAASAACRCRFPCVAIPIVSRRSG
jgi:hypothetical protein